VTSTGGYGFFDGFESPDEEDFGSFEDAVFGGSGLLFGSDESASCLPECFGASDADF
jgi:hypothetical protein